MLYNGWLHCHCITNLFIFGPDGRIIACVLNAPGSIHDSALAEWGGIYQLLAENYASNHGKCIMDSAFAVRNHPGIIRSAQDITGASTAAEILQFREATAMHQTAEWGMRAIRSSFPRLTERIPYEDGGERLKMLMLVPLLYNFRCETVGLNQIRNVFLPHWNENANMFIN